MDYPSTVSRQPLIDCHVISDLMAIGHGNLLIRVIRLFKEHVPIAMAGIDSALIQADLPLIAEKAHGLKSILASLGARRAFEICHDLELAARQEKPLNMAQQSQRLTDILQQTMAEVVRLEATYEENSAFMPECKTS